MTYSIEAASESNVHLWESFCRQSPEGSLYHGMQWKRILENALNLKLKYYLILDGRQVVGACPFTEQTSGFLRGLGEVPYSEFNHLILDDSFDVGRINDIFSLLSRNFSFLHFTTGDPAFFSTIGYENYPDDENNGIMVLDLERNDPEDIWKNFLSAKDRKKIRGFERDGFELREVRQHEEIDLFYRYYLLHMQHINGTILPLSYFHALLDSFSSDNLRIMMASRGDEIAGWWLTLSDPTRSMAFFKYLVINRAFPNRYTPTLNIQWEIVKWAWEKGYKKLSFGRQKLDPANPRFRNKSRFGAEHVPIYTRLVLLSRTASMLYRLKRGLAERQISFAASFG
jgi:hypothetical protein